MPTTSGRIRLSASAPNMIGDFFGGSYTFGDSPSGGRGPTIPSPAVTADLRSREFLASATGPRLFQLQRFQSALLTVDGEETRTSIRFAFGAEKTFLNGLTSLEVRVPFARAWHREIQDGNWQTTATLSWQFDADAQAGIGVERLVFAGGGAGNHFAHRSKMVRSPRQVASRQLSMTLLHVLFSVADGPE